MSHQSLVTDHAIMATTTPGHNRARISQSPQTKVVVPAQHYTLFSLVLGEILGEHLIPEFHLTFNSDRG